MKAKQEQPKQEPIQPDKAFQKAAQMRLLVENEMRERGERCKHEVDVALAEILKRNRCKLSIMEVRENGQTTRLWLQPVAVD